MDRKKLLQLLYLSGLFVALAATEYTEPPHVARDEYDASEPRDDSGKWTAGSGGGNGSGKETNAQYFESLNPQVEYPKRVSYWEDQIKKGNGRPIFIDANNPERILDGNHTTAAYQNLGLQPDIYKIDRKKFFEIAGKPGDTIQLLESVIKNGEAEKVASGTLNAAHGVSDPPKNTDLQPFNKQEWKKFYEYQPQHNNLDAAVKYSEAIAGTQKLTDLQKESISDFVDNSDYINDVLRGVKQPENGKCTSDIKNLDDAMAANKGRYRQCVTWRGMDSKIWGVTPSMSPAEITKALKGKTFTDPGYMSTSLVQTVAKDFCDRGIKNSIAQLPAIVQFRVPKGALQLYMEGVGTSTGQAEVLLGRGTAYKIASVESDGKSLNIIADIVSSQNNSSEAI